MLEDPAPDSLLRCFVCRRALDGGDHQLDHGPQGGVAFTGTPGWGSRFDNEQQAVGLEYYQVCVCDGCWEERRTLALGVVRERRSWADVRRYYTGHQINAALEKSRQRRTVVDIGEMFPEEPPFRVALQEGETLVFGDVEITVQKDGEYVCSHKPDSIGKAR